LVSDRLRVEQVLKNFLSNSLKFTNAGEVRLKFDRSPDAAHFISISVSDTGIGIPEEKLKKVFEAFEQVDSTTSRKYGGAGLGLTIARELASLLGGEIRLQSEFGKGCQFVLYLPQKLSMGEPSDRNSSLQPGPSTLKPSDYFHSPVSSVDRQPLSSLSETVRSSRSLLVIEDDPVFGNILCDMGKKRGFACVLATDGKSGLANALEMGPSAIILDLRLPEMDGLEVLGKLKSDPRTKSIPVHVISGQEKEADAMELGAIGFLKKPADRSQLESVLGEIEKGADSKSKKVLVLEDSDINTQEIERLLRDHQLSVVSVNSPDLALQQLKKETFDCLILTLGHSDKSHLQLLEKLETEQGISRPPIIIYSENQMGQAELDRLRRFSQSVIVKGDKSDERVIEEVSLFLHRVDSDLPKSQAKPSEKIRHREEIFEGKKVLVVDDDMRNVFALRNILAKRGFELFVAKNGKEAIEKLHNQPNMDLVLMDIMMPEMDGYEAMQYIRQEKRFHSLPIIALTAKAAASDQEKCRKAGASDYLAKPLNMDSLLSLLRVWLTQ
jgi:CheY-like chemotaxis protein